jgi:hypothetical protein
MSAKRTEPYSGPFPRGKHSHRCTNSNLSIRLTSDLRR